MRREEDGEEKSETRREEERCRMLLNQWCGMLEKEVRRKVEPSGMLLNIVEQSRKRIDPPKRENEMRSEQELC